MSQPADTEPTTAPSSARKPAGRRGFQSPLLELARFHTPDLTSALRGILQTDAENMHVARVSAWFFGSERATLHCREMFQFGKEWQQCAFVLEAAKYPRYFAALREQRVIAASDARLDAQTSEFAEGYLEPLGITAMLDVPIWHRGEMVGVFATNTLVADGSG